MTYLLVGVAVVLVLAIGYPVWQVRRAHRAERQLQARLSTFVPSTKRLHPSR